MANADKEGGVLNIIEAAEMIGYVEGYLDRAGVGDGIGKLSCQPLATKLKSAASLLRESLKPEPDGDG